MTLTTQIKRFLIEAQLRVRGEYWYTDAGELLVATETGDYNHEGHVMETIISRFCDFIGIDNTYETDATWFRTDIYDHDEGDDDRIIMAVADMKAKGLNPVMVDDMYSLVAGGQMDAREFAIKHWGWIRIAGPNMELPDLSPSRLKRAFRAFDEVVEHESGTLNPGAEVTVSTFNGKRLYITLANLQSGRLQGEDADQDTLKQYAARQVKALDDEILHPYYKSTGG